MNAQGWDNIIIGAVIFVVFVILFYKTIDK